MQLRSGTNTGQGSARAAPGRDSVNQEHSPLDSHGRHDEVQQPAHAPVEEASALDPPGVVQDSSPPAVPNPSGSELQGGSLDEAARSSATSNSRRSLSSGARRVLVDNPVFTSEIEGDEGHQGAHPAEREPQPAMQPHPREMQGAAPLSDPVEGAVWGVLPSLQGGPEDPDLGARLEPVGQGDPLRDPGPSTLDAAERRNPEANITMGEELHGSSSMSRSALPPTMDQSPVRSLVSFLDPSREEPQPDQAPTAASLEAANVAEIGARTPGGSGEVDLLNSSCF